MKYRNLNESFKRILNENKESKMRAKARAYTKSLGYGDESAKEIESTILHDIPNVRLGEFKFMLGVTRMIVSGEMDLEGGDVMRLNQYLKLITNPTHIDEYDNNLNGMSYSQIDQRFKQEQAAYNQAEVEKSNARVFDKNNSYRIVRIPDFETASEYGDYVSWCVTHDPSMYDAYTSHSMGVFYFCLKDGFERVPAEKGEGCPLDEYGLSMIAVSVNEDGSCNTITCRWNHANGGSDSVMDVAQLEDILGMNFYRTFVPRSPDEISQKKEEILNDVYEYLEYDMDGRTIGEMVDEDLFIPLFPCDDDTDFDNECEDKLFGYKHITDNYNEDIYIIVYGNGNLAYRDFFDGVKEGDGKSIVLVSKDGNINLLDVSKGKYIIDRTKINVNVIYDSYIDGLWKISYKAPNGQYGWNLMDNDGNMIIPGYVKIIDRIFKLTKGEYVGMYGALVYYDDRSCDIAIIDGDNSRFIKFLFGFDNNKWIEWIAFNSGFMLCEIKPEEGERRRERWFIVYNSNSLERIFKQPVTVGGEVSGGKYEFTDADGQEFLVPIDSPMRAKYQELSFESIDRIVKKVLNESIIKGEYVGFGNGNNAINKILMASGGKNIDPGIIMAMAKLKPEEADKIADKYIERSIMGGFGSSPESVTEMEDMKKMNDKIQKAIMNYIKKKR